MKKLNLDAVQEPTTAPRDIQPGGYICRIIMVQDVPEKEYLRVDLDIAAGEYKGFYANLAEKYGFWGCTQYWSYKDKSLSYFKGNIKALEESNSNYKFSDNEKDMQGRLIGAVFGEEEYMTNSGELRCNVKPRFVCSARRIMDHDYTIPKKRYYDAAKDKRKTENKVNYLEPVMEDASNEKLPWEEDDGLPL